MQAGGRMVDRRRPAVAVAGDHDATPAVRVENHRHIVAVTDHHVLRVNLPEKRLGLSQRVFATPTAR